VKEVGNGPQLGSLCVLVAARRCSVAGIYLRRDLDGADAIRVPGDAMNVARRVPIEDTSFGRPGGGEVTGASPFVPEAPGGLAATGSRGAARRDDHWESRVGAVSHRWRC